MGKHNYLSDDKGPRQWSSSKPANFRGGYRSNNRERRNFRDSAASYKNKPDDSTPWAKLKEAFLQQEEEINKQKNLNSTEKDKIFESRDKNYKKFLIKEKQKEETVWEEISPPSQKSEKEGPEIPQKNKRKDLAPIHREMTSQEKKRLKGIITKATNRALGSTFANSLEDLAYNGVKIRRK